MQEETGVPGENLSARSGMDRQPNSLTNRVVILGIEPGPQCCEASVSTTTPARPRILDLEFYSARSITLTASINLRGIHGNIHPLSIYVHKRYCDIVCKKCHGVIHSICNHFVHSISNSTVNCGASRYNFYL